MRGLVIVMVVLSWLVACGSGGAKLRPLPADARILAFGDSLTFGKDVRPEESFPARLQAGIARTVVNGGQPGELSAEGLKRLPIWLNEYEPRLLILCHGANDLLRSLSEDKVRENLRAMVKMAKSRGVDVVLLAVPKFGGMRSSPKLYEEIAAEFEIPLEAEVLKEIVREERYHRDAVHPNAEGYQRVADALSNLLRRAGAL